MNLREEAKNILEDRGLLRILEKYGKPYPVGSYLCDLMAWEDLDISMECETPTQEMLYRLTEDVNRLLKPYQYEGRIIDKNKMFYSCKTSLNGRRWSVDIWFRDRKDIEKTICFCRQLQERTQRDPTKRDAILSMKRGLIDRGLYGIDKNPHCHYHSGDIYHAVLDENVDTVDKLIKSYPIHND